MQDIQLFFNKANILIVNDPDSNVEMLIGILKLKYYNIKNTLNYKSVIEFKKEQLPDIILIYTNMDKMEGFKICTSLKNNKKFQDIPIILIGSSNENLDREKVFISGGADYLNIPFSSKEIISKVETYLKLRFMQLELQRIDENHEESRKERSENLKEELDYMKLVEMKLRRENDEYKKSYEEIMRINEDLAQTNKLLEERANDGQQQLHEIASELKEFNVMLEDEIAERNKTGEALKESERQFRYAIEESPLPIMLYAENGEIKKINRTWTDITGYTIEEIPTISEWAALSDVFIGDLEGTNIDKLFNLEKRQNDGEYYIKTKESDARIWNFYSAYIGKSQDGHKLLMRVAIDITEKKHMEELEKSVEEERKKLYEIKEYDRIKTEFFSNISHELRTPINVIFSALQMHELKLKDCSSKDNTVDKYKYTNIMKQNCYRLLRLVNNIIDITKIDSGYFDMNENNVDIVNLVENITLSVADYIENKGLSLIFDTVVEEKNISCDPEKIERIILNILSNAVKFTSSGGEITVNIEDCIENICIKIKDTGRGIPEDKIDSIFKRFVQVDKSLTRDCEGSGIGLSLVKCLVELHDGTISVESDIGQGTEFIIHIPCRLTDEVNKEVACCDSMGENLIERINLEFSDIYK
ncbi:Non-motile and phage-resistance protein [Clostridium puniceum]|uniref:Stage 0 sporulation protein A homolog n=1 Tax=Clostridium puniceum TaxID=29367 RepID=A0A1S8TH74_9CLOT|nr:ATP-binding protein [Clostridium puniceum]OOM77123.1 Non-motile and phage-resistance protein [Clostridium puniceum]